MYLVYHEEHEVLQKMLPFVPVSEKREMQIFGIRQEYRRR